MKQVDFPKQRNYHEQKSFQLLHHLRNSDINSTQEDVTVMGSIQRILVSVDSAAKQEI